MLVDSSQFSVMERADHVFSNSLENGIRTRDFALRIIFFAPTYFTQDATTSTIQSLKAHLTARGAVVKIVTSYDSMFDQLAPDQLEDVIAIPGAKLLPVNGCALGAGLDDNSIAAITAFRPNCVHFTAPDLVALDGIAWCRKNHVAFVGTWHSDGTEHLSQFYLGWLVRGALETFYKTVYEQIPTVFVPSAQQIRKLREYDIWNNNPYGKATTLQVWGRTGSSVTPVESRMHWSRQFRASHGIADSAIVILCCDSHAVEDLPAQFIGVIQRLQADGHPVRALLLTATPDDARWSQLRGAVILPTMHDAALTKAIASADIYFCASQHGSNTHSPFVHVLKTALDCSCRVVTPPHEMVQHGTHGFVCAAKDADDYYHAVWRLVVDARARAAARESEEASEQSALMQQMLEHYKDAIVQHSDLAFMTKYLTNPAGAGRNFLSVCTFNFAMFRTLLSLLVCAPCMSRQPNVWESMRQCSEALTRTRRALAQCCGADVVGVLTGEVQVVFRPPPPEQRIQLNAWQSMALLFFVGCVGVVYVVVMVKLLMECF